jgi:HYR domain
MQVRKVVLAALVVSLVSAAALAQEAMRVSPTTLRPGDESFLTIFVSGLSTTDVIAVTFNGSAGTETVEPSFVDPTSLMVWVPSSVMLTSGRHQVDVYVTRAEGVLHFGPGFFDVDIPAEEPPPVFTLLIPELIVGEARSLQGGVVDYQVASTDGAPVNCTPPSGSNFPFGVSSVSCSATNSLGQTASGSFAVFVLDTVPPNIHVPANISTDNPVVTFTVTADDNIDPEPDVFCAPASGSTFQAGVTRVRCFASDLHANFAFGEFNVHVTGGPPVLTLPEDISAEATSAAGAVVNYVVEATEEGVITCSPSSGSLFPFGQTIVNCSARNAAGTTTGSFNVFVDDNTPPDIAQPDILAEATSAAGAVVTFSPIAIDLVDGLVTVSCTPLSGDTFPIGTTLVHCTATDSHTNVANETFTVTVADTRPPVISAISATPNTLWPPDHKMYPVKVSVTATDAVDPSPVCQIVSVASNQPTNGTGDGDMAPDWKINGPFTLDLRAERSKNQDRVYTIKVQCSDASANTSSSTVQVRVTQSKR